MRLPLIPESEITPTQRPLYDAYREEIRQSFSELVAVRGDGALLGPWAVWLHVPQVGEAMRQLIVAINQLGGLGNSAKQVVILMTGAHFNAAYEIYAHALVGAKAGLSDAKISTLAAGERPTDLTPEEGIVADVTAALLKGGVLPGPVYERAMTELGQDALKAIVFVIGQYCAVSVLLNAFNVPSEAQEPG